MQTPCIHFVSGFSDLSLYSFERISVRNPLMPFWLARMLPSLWRATKKSSMLTISDWGRNSSDGNNSAQWICFIQGARNSTTLFADHCSSAAGSEHLNMPTASRFRYEQQRAWSLRCWALNRIFPVKPSQHISMGTDTCLSCCRGDSHCFLRLVNIVPKAFQHL